MDNLTEPTGEVDNSQAQDAGIITDSQTTTETIEPTGFSWQDNLRSDLKGWATTKNFGDDIDGLNKALESHANLEKLLGHEKVPIPKGENDTEGWNRFSKALGIPDKAEGYGLANFEAPPEMADFGIDKNKFAEVVHAYKLTPSQAKGLWETYNRMNVESFNKAVETQKANITEVVNRLRGEWGDAYETNVELAQTVINKFSDNNEVSDFLTSTLSSDPKGIKFLAKIGSQFAENKMGDFQMKQYSTTPDEAAAEISKMVRDMDGPYMNQSGKYSGAEHQAAIDRVNALRASIIRSKGQA